MRLLFFMLISIILITACNQTKTEKIETTHNSINDMLTKNPNVDIFQLNGIIYINASNIEWVQKKELIIGKKVGEISKQYRNGVILEDEMATKLPLGSEIYEPGE